MKLNSVKLIITYQGEVRTLEMTEIKPELSFNLGLMTSNVEGGTPVVNKQFTLTDKSFATSDDLKLLLPTNTSLIALPTSFQLFFNDILIIESDNAVADYSIILNTIDNEVVERFSITAK